MKRNVNSDDQQSHEYQQNKQSPLFPNHWTQKGPQHITLEIQAVYWYGHKNVAVLTLKCYALTYVMLQCFYSIVFIFVHHLKFFFVQRTYALTFTPRPKYILRNKTLSRHILKHVMKRMVYFCVGFCLLWKTFLFKF